MPVFVPCVKIRCELFVNQHTKDGFKLSVCFVVHILICCGICIALLHIFVMFFFLMAVQYISVVF